MNLLEILTENKSGVRYLENISNETFQVDMEMDKSGLNVILTPTNPQGDMIKNLTPEEIETLEKSLFSTLSPKFSKYGMSLTQDGKGKKTNSFSVKFQVPLESMFPLFKNIISK